jgi:adenylate cyclase
MSTEIERKFLTINDDWKTLATPVRYRQGYMNSDRGHQVLIHTNTDPGRTSGFLEIRSPNLQFPIEHLIPIQDAVALHEQLCFDLTTTTDSGCTRRTGSLSTNAGHTLRSRIAGNRGIFTIKTKTVGISRSEFEFEIPIVAAEQLLNTVCEQPQIDKTRRKITHEGFIWEVDEFAGENLGLVIAEIELSHEAQSFTKPHWVGPEVTGDRRYYNSALAQTPFTKWPKA